MNKIELVKTCSVCPEQYDAFKGSHLIGYLRLRWGHFTCDYLPEEKLTDHDIRLVDHIFTNDEYKGMFENDEERNYWLEKSKQELLKYYNKNKKYKKLHYDRNNEF